MLLAKNTNNTYLPPNKKQLISEKQTDRTLDQDNIASSKLYSYKEPSKRTASIKSCEYNNELIAFNSVRLYGPGGGAPLLNSGEMKKTPPHPNITL